MFCRNCGNKLTDGAKFCNNCGTPVNDINNNSINNNQYNNVNNGNNNMYNNANNNVYQKQEPRVPGACIASYILFAIIVLIHIINITSILSIVSDTGATELVAVLGINIISVPIFYLIGLITTIVAKVSHPKNLHSKICLVIYIILGLIVIAEAVVLISAIGSCIAELDNCSNLG